MYFRAAIHSRAISTRVYMSDMALRAWKIHDVTANADPIRYGVMVRPGFLLGASWRASHHVRVVWLLSMQRGESRSADVRPFIITNALIDGIYLKILIWPTRTWSVRPTSLAA